MERVTGVGGIFFKAKDPEAMYQWYERHLGIKRGADGSVLFKSRAEDDSEAGTVWSVFPHDTKYFDPGTAPFMVNYRVADMDALLSSLREEGVEILGGEDYEFGRFAWIMDP